MRRQKMSGVFYKSSVSKKEMMGAIKAVRTNRTIYKNLGKSIQSVVGQAKQEQKEQQTAQKVEIRKGQQRQERMMKEMFGWRKQGEEKSGLSLADLRKKSMATGQSVTAGKTAANKPGGVNAKFVPRSGAALSSLPHLSRHGSSESLETHPRGLSEIQPDQPAPVKEEAKPAAKTPAPAESKPDSSGGTDDMMLD